MQRIVVETGARPAYVVVRAAAGAAQDGLANRGTEPPRQRGARERTLAPGAPIDIGEQV